MTTDSERKEIEASLADLEIDIDIRSSGINRNMKQVAALQSSIEDSKNDLIHMLARKKALLARLDD